MIASSQKHWSGDVADLLRVGEGFVLADVDTRSTPGYEKDKAHAADDLQSGAAELDEYQERLYARSRVDETNASVLLVLQAMDSAGKGGIIRHVVGSVDPQGIVLSAFKKPTDEELKHDFLWRVKQRLPVSGMIGVFDRSHYEDVLIGRVRRLASEQEIERRYAAINDFERQLTDSGTRVVKVMLHISPDEQKKRLMRRLNRLDKHWKYNPTDVDERELWPQYMAAYQTVFERTSTEHAPWFVVPADHKWYGRLAVQNLLLEALEDINPQWPKATFDVEAEKLRLAAT
ncbi:MAG TPA: PPK2 family polyphosphate kinase [Microbacterium sp.]|nr:PPK2 family polyphosphate kinase [Microbacterium sp.]